MSRLYVLLKLAAFALLAGALPWRAQAQAVSPAVMEYPGAGSHRATEGHFEVSNSSLETVFVTMEMKSFSIGQDGNATFRPLDATTQVELSATSLRLPPKQTRTIYYKAIATAYPAWFCIYSNFSGLPRRNGVSVQMDLPHTVYLLGAAKAQQQDIVLTHVIRHGNELRGVMQNRGSAFTRVLELEVTGPHLKKSEGGFPLLPGDTREFAIALAPETTPSHLRARLAGFHIDQDLP